MIEGGRVVFDEGAYAHAGYLAVAAARCFVCFGTWLLSEASLVASAPRHRKCQMPSAQRLPPFAIRCASLAAQPVAQGITSESGPCRTSPGSRAGCRSWWYGWWRRYVNGTSTCSFRRAVSNKGRGERAARWRRRRRRRRRRPEPLPRDLLVERDNGMALGHRGLVRFDVGVASLVNGTVGR